MADDWKPGDLALCVKVGPWRWARSGAIDPLAPIQGGMILTVRKIGIGIHGNTVLWFNEDVQSEDLSGSYAARSFRKVTPESEDAFDREVITHMAGQEVEA